tara:strand:- start:293 stop:1576 length:1284 start_codon:yes stop_codon:yes gene_type:complete
MALRPFPSFRFQQLNRAYQTDPRNLLGKQLQQTGISTEPVATPLQGLGRLAQALVGAKLQRDAIDAQVKREDDFTNQITSMIPENANPAMKAFAVANPTAFSNALAQSLFQPQTTSEVVNLGGNLRGVQTTQTGPFGRSSTAISNLTQIKPNALTTAQKNAIALGLVPGTAEYNKYIRDVTGKSGTNINVNTGQPITKEQEEAGKKRVARIEKLYFTPAENSQETISNINQALTLLENNPDVSQLGGETLLTLKENLGGLANIFGVDPKKLGIDTAKLNDQQVFRSIINKLVLDQTSKLKGALSNKELDFSGKATAQIGTTAEANKVILAFQKQAAIKSQIVAEQVNTYFDKAGTYGGATVDGKRYTSVTDYVNQFVKNNEIFGPAMIDEFNTLAEIKAYKELRGRNLTEAEDTRMIERIREIQQGR